MPSSRLSVPASAAWLSSLAFVLIWSTGFIVGRAIVPVAQPSLFLLARFCLAAEAGTLRRDEGMMFQRAVGAGAAMIDNGLQASRPMPSCLGKSGNAWPNRHGFGL